jgi:xylulokinase
MGVILSATAALEWFALTAGTTAEALVRELGPTPSAPGSAMFLPYLSGERTPHNDAAIRGAFLGLAHIHGRDALTRAVLEGVAFALRDSLEALRAAGTAIAAPRTACCRRSNPVQTGPKTTIAAARMK